RWCKRWPRLLRCEWGREADRSCCRTKSCWTPSRSMTRSPALTRRDHLMQIDLHQMLDGQLNVCEPGRDSRATQEASVQWFGIQRPSPSMNVWKDCEKLERTCFTWDSVRLGYRCCHKWGRCSPKRRTATATAR